MMLTPQSFDQALRHLGQKDPDLQAVLDQYGPPIFWSRPTGFASLVWIILEQQVSLASAKAAFDKVSRMLDTFSPTRFLDLSDDDLRAAGFSRQKMRYTRILAEAILSGELDLENLTNQETPAARQALTSLTGIGNWTADIYLMSANRAPDIWPVGDLGLVVGVQMVKELAERPSKDYLEELGETYRPWRTVATHLYWQAYLKGKLSASIDAG